MNVGNMKKKKEFKQPFVDSEAVEELSKKLLEVNNELIKAETERKNMLENISHDLRAPLTAIRSTVDLLKQHYDDKSKGLDKEELVTYINILDNRTKTLEVLIQDLFFMTCLDSGREEFRFERIPLAQFLEEYYFAMEIDERFKKYSLHLEVPMDMDVYINADVAKLSRVLDNLFNNARKYSEGGSNIILGAYTKDNMAYFYVKDNGNGIPEDAIPYIFDRTFRVNKSRTPDKESSNGLGLAIAKNIVETHGGSIFCESIVGEGSIFTVIIPTVE